MEGDGGARDPARPGVKRRSVLGGMALGAAAGPALAAPGAPSPVPAEASGAATRRAKPLIAVFSGPTATIQNSGPLVTSRPEGQALRPQRLATPVTVYVEQFSAHPLERDAAELYGPPDGWMVDGVFSATPSPRGVPVYKVELKPDDGLFLLPYTARQKSGETWKATGETPTAPAERSRQTFYPDASRIYEEIDRFAFDTTGYGGLLSRKAGYEFFRASPSGGYTKGLAAKARTDMGDGDVAPERPGRDYFAYSPHHLRTEPDAAALARATNVVQRALLSGRYAGAQWLEGSPTIEESLYWLNLLIDTTTPIVGHSAQRAHGLLSADGDKNIVDGVEYILSDAWADETGRDRIGAVLIVDEQVFSARDVAKTDARPGGYAATGGHGGIVAAMGGRGEPVATYIPNRKSTYRSELRLTRLPDQVAGVRRGANGKVAMTTVRVKDAQGLRAEAMPFVSMAKFTRWPHRPDALDRPDPAILEQIEMGLATAPLSGLIAEGAVPTGRMDPTAELAMRIAVLSGVPVVRCGRGNTAGFAGLEDPLTISGRNLTPTKARILLMACLLKFGAPPPAADPYAPTSAELEAVTRKIAAYQAIFETH